MSERTALLVPTKGDLSPEANKALGALPNDRQRAFVFEYLVDYNGAQAAIRAGYSAEAAKQQACLLLTKTDLQRALRELVKAQIEHAIEKTRGTVLDRLEILEQDAVIARTTPYDFIERAYGQMLTFKDPAQIPEMKKRALKKLKAGNGVIEVELEPKHPSLQRLAQHHRLIGPGSYVQENEGSEAGELEDWEEAHATAQWLEEMAARTGATAIAELAALLYEAGPDDEADANEIEEAKYVDIVTEDDATRQSTNEDGAGPTDANTGSIDGTRGCDG